MVTTNPKEKYFAYSGKLKIEDMTIRQLLDFIKRDMNKLGTKEKAVVFLNQKLYNYLKYLKTWEND